MSATMTGALPEAEPVEASFSALRVIETHNGDAEKEVSRVETRGLAGDTAEHGLNPKWKNMEWWQAGMLMLAESISLGIFALPSTLATVGLIPGIILLFTLGLLSTYTGYTVGQFKLAYPKVHNMADACRVLCSALGPKWGRFGFEFGGGSFTLFLIFIMGSHILTWGIAMDTITNHAVCNIVWGVVALLLFWAIDLPQTMKNTSYWSIASFTSVSVAALVTMIAIGIHDKGSKGANKYELWPAPGLTFYAAFQSVTNIIFAYGGHACYLTFIAEMKKPRDFPKSLCLLQSISIVVYITTAVVIYRFGGKDIKSPALGSSGPLFSRIAYGVALPTIVIAGVIFGHVAAKYAFVRMYTTRERPAKTWWIWALIVGAFWIAAWIIAESIPNFNDLLGLISSLFASWFSYGIPGAFWLFMNKGKYTSSWRKMVLTALNLLAILVAAAVFGIGTYASATSIHNNRGAGKSWSCGGGGDSASS